MKSFKLEKVRGNQDVTHEALLSLAVFLFIFVPLLCVLYLFVH